METQFIRVSSQGGLGVITLNRPPLNVLNIAMMEEINTALDAWKEDRNLKAVLLRAEGKAFSAGVEVAEHMGDLAPKMIEVFHGMFRRMDALGAVTVASVRGACLGGGCEVAAFCDLVIASEKATFGQPEIKVGVFPPIAALVFPRYLGRKAAMELIMSGRIIRAQEALGLGLINRVVPDPELEQATEEFVNPYLELSAEVIRKTKKALKAGLMDDLEPALRRIEAVYLEELMATQDAQEGLHAFLEKRKPIWKNA